MGTDRTQNPIQSSTGSLPIMSHGGGGSVSVCWNPPQGTQGNGGSGGGSGSSSSISTTYGVNLQRQGYVSGTLNSTFNWSGGAGTNISSSNMEFDGLKCYNGGAGLTSSITGSPVARGGGGAVGGTVSTGHQTTGGTGTAGGGDGGDYNGGYQWW